jgi:hypothetical protein
VQVVDGSEFPPGSFLLQCRQAGCYIDCYRVAIDREVDLSEFIVAFYNTRLFRLERFILKWAISRPSTNRELQLLADSAIKRFAAWEVEARAPDQILLADFSGATKSWLMTEPVTGGAASASRLYFGSAIVPTRNLDNEKPQMGKTFSILLPFHKIYSRALLSSALRDLKSTWN